MLIQHYHPQLCSAIFIVLALGVSGCSVFNPAGNVISLKSLGDVQVVAMEATHRAIIASRSTSGGILRYCAEPPPDATANLASSLSSALNIKDGLDDEISAEFANAIAKSVNNLYSRSHAIQLFRDASFSLCQAHLTGFAQVDALETENSIRSMLVNMIAADERSDEIEREIDSLKRQQSQIPVPIDMLNKALEEVKKPSYSHIFRADRTEEEIVRYHDEIARKLVRIEQRPDLKKAIDDLEAESYRIADENKIMGTKMTAMVAEGVNGSGLYFKIFEDLVKTTAELLKHEITANAAKAASSPITSNEVISAQVELLELLAQVRGIGERENIQSEVVAKEDQETENATAISD